MSIIHQEKQRKLDTRQAIFPVVILVVFGVFFCRLWYLQVVESPALAARAEAFRNATVPKPAPRGRIVDRNGVPLAAVKSEIVITAVPAEVRKHPKSLERLSQMLAYPLEKLQEKVKDASWRPYLPSPIYLGAPIDIATKVAEGNDEFPGLGVQTLPMRTYPNTLDFSHIIGYAWVPDANDEKRIKAMGRKPADYVGKTGVEWVYEKALMGQEGKEQMEVDAKGRPLRRVKSDNPKPGDQVVLSIDSDLQKVSQEALNKRGYKGAVVALDPKTGEVLALTNVPTYDISQFARGISSKEYKALMDDPGKPLLNRAIYSSYAPGSTFKIVTSIAAYETGNWSPSAPAFCPGYYSMGRGRPFRCLGHHGSITYDRAMAKSCNTYFITLGIRSGPDALRQACAELGLGDKTGIDLRSEGRGLVPTAEWVKKHMPDGRWYPGNTANFSVGQGELHVTPLQMATVISLVANRGVSYKPHVVRAIVPADNTGTLKPVEPEVLGKVDASPEFWNALQAALFHVIEGGTATRHAKIAGLRWAGKTGSAEKKGNQKTHSWFVAYAPLEDPKIAICVMLENAGHGGDEAAPVAAEIVRHYLIDGPAKKKPATPE